MTAVAAAEIPVLKTKPAAANLGILPKPSEIRIEDGFLMGKLGKKDAENSLVTIIEMLRDRKNRWRSFTKDAFLHARLPGDRKKWLEAKEAAELRNLERLVENELIDFDGEKQYSVSQKFFSLLRDHS